MPEIGKWRAGKGRKQQFCVFSAPKCKGAMQCCIASSLAGCGVRPEVKCPLQDFSGLLVSSKAFTCLPVGRKVNTAAKALSQTCACLSVAILADLFRSELATQPTLEGRHSDLLFQGTAGGILIPFLTISFQHRIMTGLYRSTQEQ